ncbi:5-formyltetrahydrofolate cyclo-ligase [Paenibacillus sp. UNC499MF]|uniref:5-formyltetrahydrofolate cyclo-ligase n=1 Tax=Paenibacillus sp. UNC499MF TaxID=1502751 RepID=UPI00089FC2E2|nr:5-formyltetrahydrofolate cyclo-ligase [Paenibacillus sp. UNC499MF]SEG70132.1 5,10-methenyltetrahydrofolate synthetase [Paenibacillus sp. UNC499MF]
MNNTDKKELRRRIERLRSALTPEERAGRERRINERLTAWLKGVIAGRNLSPGAFAGALPAPAKRPEDTARLEGACPEDGASGIRLPANREIAGSFGTSGAPDIPIVLAYVPFRTECRIHETVEACWEAGIRVYAPRSLHVTRELLFHEIRRWEDLQEGMHGIMEPDPLSPALEDPLAASAVLVPGLAFDTACGRLGYGGGYYDRFLQKLLTTAREEGRAAPFFAAAAFDVQLVEHLPVEPHDIRLDVLITESAAYNPGSGSGPEEGRGSDGASGQTDSF